MKIIRKILAWYYKVPFRTKEWYNYQAMIKSDDYKDRTFIVIFDDKGRYISCPKEGGLVTYSIKGVEYIYKVVGFKNSNRYSDWLYDSDYINPIIEFVKKK